jgi:hypothetical protein
MAKRADQELDPASLVLRAVHERPGCSAWALGVLVEPPDGLMLEEWRALLERELPRLHTARRVQATSYDGGRRAYWPAKYDVPEIAGEVV